MATKEKRGRGQPTKYKPEYCDQILKFFDVEPTREAEITITLKNGSVITKTEERPNHLPFLSGFARKIDVTEQTLWNWTKSHPEFFDAYARAKAMQAEMLHTCGLLGLYREGYAKLAAINLTDWKSDKSEVEHSGSITLNDAAIALGIARGGSPG